MYAAVRESAAQGRSAAAAEGLRRIDVGMIDAVLAGDRLARVAALAALRLRGAAAIVPPAVDLTVVEPRHSDSRLPALVRCDACTRRPRALDEIVRAVGIDQPVLGSDRPVVAPRAPAALGPGSERAISQTNPARLLAPLSGPA